MIAILLLSGLSYLGLPWVSGSVEDIAVRPGQNITLFCDCKLSVGTLVAWLRNCSHVNQPSLVLRLKRQYLPGLSRDEVMSPLPGFQFVKNISSNSYDLRITNVTEFDEGRYFCGTYASKVGETKYVYNYGQAITRIKMSSRDPVVPHQPSVSWVVMVPAAAVLLSNICFILLYHFCQKNDARVHTRAHQVDCFSTTVVFGTIERKHQ